MSWTRRNALAFGSAALATALTPWGAAGQPPNAAAPSPYAGGIPGLTLYLA